MAIARALITQPDVVSADEPTAALDPHIAEGILGLLRSAVDELGQTVVVVTHDPTVAVRADRLLVLDHGRLIDDLAQPARTPGAFTPRATSWVPSAWATGQELPYDPISWLTV